MQKMTIQKANKKGKFKILAVLKDKIVKKLHNNKIIHSGIYMKKIVLKKIALLFILNSFLCVYIHFKKLFTVMFSSKNG